MAIEVRNIKPEDSESNVSINADIEFDLVATDGDSIDISTLVITIESVSKITGDTLTNTYTYSDTSSIQYQGTSSYYKIFCNPEIPFEHGMSVTVKVDVDDTLSNSMTQYEISFTTMYLDLISDFMYAMVYRTQNIPVYFEQLFPDSHTGPQVFNSAFTDWNQKPRVQIYKNEVIQTSGFTIDYNNGKVVFDSALDYNDIVKASYTFRMMSDHQIKAYFNQAAALWRIHPPNGGPQTIYQATVTERAILFIGAALFAFNDLIFALSIQEKRVIFDNRSWDEAWKTALDIFKSMRDNYKDMWDKALESKKYKLPRISSIVTPMYTLPGGRSRFFRYLYKQGGSGI